MSLLLIPGLAASAAVPSAGCALMNEPRFDSFYSGISVNSAFATGDTLMVTAGHPADGGGILRLATSDGVAFDSEEVGVPGTITYTVPAGGLSLVYWDVTSGNATFSVACIPAPDSDGDGVVDGDDAFPFDPTRAVECQPGTYGAFSCEPAPPGTFVDVVGALAATPCPAGTYQSAAGSTSCSVADPGSFVSVAGAVVATPCPVGTYQPAAGSTSCLVADPGFFVAVEGAVAQTACPAGFTSEAGAVECYPINTAPTADVGGPYLGAVNAGIVFDGSGSSDDEGDALTYAWSFGDGATGSGLTPSHVYAEAGIYDVCLTASDGDLVSEQVCAMVVVYDPSAGFVTGGGWFASQEGAYSADPTLSGKAEFGFVSKYKKGASVPTGNTEFRFATAGFVFESDSYEWLVVNQGGTNAQFKGTGTVDGGSEIHQFMIWAGDGSPDTFRIKIWIESAGGEQVVYDNGVGQPLGGGSIVIHTAKK